MPYQLKTVRFGAIACDPYETYNEAWLAFCLAKKDAEIICVSLADVTFGRLVELHRWSRDA